MIRRKMITKIKPSGKLYDRNCDYDEDDLGDDEYFTEDIDFPELDFLDINELDDDEMEG